MDPFNIIKGAIEKNLEKQGMNLSDFESALANMDTPEGAVKVASLTGGLLGSNTLSGIKDNVTSPYFAFTSGVGGLMGLGADMANTSIESQNKKLDELRQNLAMLQRMTQNLHREHGLE